ncbi:hypothetical protein F4X86_03375 [Candidatus Saccharibacteria bacterium]|nr:hypothetical protein [Candidatus Saccharibacteria bacterium]
MADLVSGAKKIGIDRNQRTAMIAVGLAAFVLVFSIFFGLRLYSKQQYQSHVISELKCANQAINDSRSNLSALETAFNKFNTADPILGDGKQGTVQNSAVVLRSLPVKYKKNQIQHFWGNAGFLKEGTGTGLLSASERRAEYTGLPETGEGYTSNGQIAFPDGSGGAEGEAAAGGLQEIEFTFQVDVNSQEEMDKLFEDLDNFIMPVKILSLDVRFMDQDTSDGGYANLNMRLKTYVQGERNIDISEDTLEEGSTTGGSC